MKEDCPHFHVKKRTLLAISGTVWLVAGFNVARLGILSYKELKSIGAMQIALSGVVFLLFGFMFYKMCLKHEKRIGLHPKATRPAWHFFDLKSYIIMAIMMSGGIWLRAKHILPISFIAIFYTGLGLALAFSGVFFWFMFFSNRIDRSI